MAATLPGLTQALVLMKNCRIARACLLAIATILVAACQSNPRVTSIKPAELKPALQSLVGTNIVSRGCVTQIIHLTTFNACAEQNKSRAIHIFDPKNLLLSELKNKFDVLPMEYVAQGQFEGVVVEGSIHAGGTSMNTLGIELSAVRIDSWREY